MLANPWVTDSPCSGGQRRDRAGPGVAAGGAPVPSPCSLHPSQPGQQPGVRTASWRRPSAQKEWGCVGHGMWGGQRVPAKRWKPRGPSARFPSVPSKTSGTQSAVGQLSKLQSPHCPAPQTPHSPIPSVNPCVTPGPLPTSIPVPQVSPSQLLPVLTFSSSSQP